MHKSDWNQLVIDMLLTLYLSMEEKNHWTSRSHQSITHDVTSKFDQCHKCWRKAQPLVRNDGTRKSMQEDPDSQGNTAPWKFETHQKVTSTLLSDRNATGKDDLPVWVYLNSIVETLDKDGMSSDESDIDDCEVQVFRVKSMPWRANFSHEMKIIDEQRLVGVAIFTPRESKPAKHLHNTKRESLWPAVAGLPRAFYNPSWLSEQRPMFKYTIMITDCTIYATIRPDYFDQYLFIIVGTAIQVQLKFMSHSLHKVMDITVWMLQASP
ncbi:hypothetical protein DFH29DRAFT_878519 [Suillus ampliporus]|nr:hypothetical protein DFH29DRAFT_878519 [Suillus ampliporus]